MAVLVAGTAWLACLQTDGTAMYIVIGLAIVGLGTGMFISPNNSVLMGSAPRHRRGVAGGIMGMGRNVGMVVGVGLAGAIVTTMMVTRPADRLIEAITTSFWVASAIAFVGIGTSMIDGDDEAPGLGD
jgi:MFS family permease